METYEDSFQRLH